MFVLQQSIRSAALRAGRLAVATAVVAGPAVVAAQPAAVRYPVTEEQRQTANQVAQSGVPLSALAANAPDSHTVKPGDTLWGISSIFLTNPWRWPELWGMNKEQIANPHLIYPGQTLRLVRSDGRARLEIAATGGDAAPAGDVVLAVAGRARRRRRAGGVLQYPEPRHRAVPVQAGDRLAGRNGQASAHRRHAGPAGRHSPMN